MIYRVDLHVHTLRGSADPALCLSELVRAARQAGLDAIAITDTDYCTPVPIELRGVVLIPGCEVSTLGGSILGVFLERPLDFVRLRQHGLPTADETVLEIHRCGGLAILAHPFAQTDANPALFPIRPDAVETACACVVPPNSAAGQRALLWATEHQRPPRGRQQCPLPPESWVRFTRRSPAPAYPALS
ncbi:PHP domain-containing protein [Ruthenibacterium lactatiformans]|uniref:PHP domain-containing protein n=1 Tax=Ruthenibacterium lactatiformans TaxID=1550024 RepID=UPI0035217AC7